MSRKNKKILLIMFIIIIVSSALLISKFGDVSANDVLKTDGADVAAASTKPATVLNESVFWSLAKLMAALMAVVAGIYGFLYLLRRMMGNKLSGNKQHNIIEVLETTYVAQKKSVSLIRFADRAVLIGVADSGINVLAELDGEQTSKVLAEFAVEKPTSGFAGIMKDAKDRLMSLNIGKLKTLQAAEDGNRPQAAL
ncbi:MAG: flagellar biosynthetic protein FliO [candidate division Zixibacteria bacterium HGW-Zixibacteria-1]|nr:MAG: flagellar biosynthetic protein FliO [candidate division Zixibacteria bacterium HGW-Zixibacteria-1]